MARHIARMGEIRNAYKIFVTKSEAKRPLERPAHYMGQRQALMTGISVLAERLPAYQELCSMQFE